MSAYQMGHFVATWSVILIAVYVVVWSMITAARAKNKSAGGRRPSVLLTLVVPIISIVIGVVALASVLSPIVSKFDVARTWVTFTEPGGSFSIQFPKNPTYKAQRIPTKSGLSTNHWYSVNQGNRFHYSIGYGDYPVSVTDPALQNSVLDAFQEGGVRNAKGSLLESKPISLGKFAGRDIRYTNPSSEVVRVRLYFSGSRYYMLMAWPDNTKEGSVNGQKFFDSFQIK